MVRRFLSLILLSKSIFGLNDRSPIICKCKEGLLEKHDQINNRLTKNGQVNEIRGKKTARY